MKEELEDLLEETKTILDCVLKMFAAYSLIDVRLLADEIRGLRLLADEIRGLRHELLSLFDYNFTYRLFALLLVEAETQAMLSENTLRYGNLSQVAINLKRVIALLEVEIEELNKKENGK